MTSHGKSCVNAQVYIHEIYRPFPGRNAEALTAGCRSFGSHKVVGSNPVIHTFGALNMLGQIIRPEERD